MRPEIQQAVQLVRQGGPESVQTALALLQQTVFSFSMKVCGHREDAQDTMQETLLRTVPALERFESPQALAVWLYKVARSRCLISRRRSKFAPRETLSLDDVMPDRRALEELFSSGNGRPDEQLLRKENSAELQRAVWKIPPDYRMILVLHDMEELSTAEIAHITGLREGTIRVRLHRARTFLRDELNLKPRRHRQARPQNRDRHCREIFAALSDYLDEELEASACDKLLAHLAGCKPCEAYLHSLEETIQRCKKHCPEELKASLAAKVRQVLMEAYKANLTRRSE